MNKQIQILQDIAKKCHKEEEVRLFKDEDIKIKLRTLEGIREAELHRECQEKGLKGLAYLHECKIQFVARSITEINGEEINRDEEGKIDRELVQAVGSFSQSLIDHLFLKYASLVGDSDRFVESLRKTVDSTEVKKE